jgi:cytochrome c-type biogenesis protein CcmH
LRLRALGLLIPLLLLAFSPVRAAAPDLEDRTREIASELRCVVCQNLSVADSPSEMAQQMRAIVREQLQAGKSPEQIKDFFVSKYGEWVLLKPKTTGVSALLWWLPYTALAFGLTLALLFLRRWVKKRSATSRATTIANQQLRDELTRVDFTVPDIEDNSARAELVRERMRLRDELKELEFDYSAGKLSQADYTSLRQEVENKAAAALQQLNALPPEPLPKAAPRKPIQVAPQPTAARARFKRWQLIAGGTFLLLFGVALGGLLTQSIKPRASEQDSMTGDFMTGTSSASPEARSALAEGKAAFAKQEYPKAIEAFKKVLSADPNQPEAHAYMGFILIQAGHGDGALMAFDKALAQAPNLPMALWGKGMLLYQEKKDFAGARAIFEQLLNLMPPGEGRNEVAKTLAEIPASGQSPRPAAATTAPAGNANQTISGKITIDAKLKDKLDPQAALFIIARPAGGGGGPPLAVKKIDKPTFPLTYSLGQENVMMQGMPFTGKMNITVRLDKDGNPVTRGPGDLTGDYKKNPVDVGAKNVDVVIDQLSQ